MASKGCIGIVMCGTGNVPEDATVCLPNTALRLLGTNPIAFAFPLGDLEPFVIDLSTSTIPFHKIYKARLCKEELAPGALVDRSGNETTNPEDFYLGGAITLAGGYKGLALSLMISILSGLSLERLNGKEVGGVFLQAIHLSHMDRAQEYKHTVKNFLSALRKSSSSNTANNRLPGDKSAALRKKYMKEGIPIAAELLRRLDNYLKKIEKKMQTANSKEQSYEKV
jgi:LDH2 family malate/lactate/ureidoglycolate dehydrogenase